MNANLGMISPQSDFWSETLNAINSNKYVFAILMLVLNMGARYLELDLADHHKQFLSSKVIRRLVIFTIVFIATRDVIVSLLVTAAFIIIVLNLFNTESEYCILPDYLKQFDTNKDGKLSTSEIVNAAQKIAQNPPQNLTKTSDNISGNTIDNSAEKKNFYLSFFQK